MRSIFDLRGHLWIKQDSKRSHSFFEKGKVESLQKAISNYVDLKPGFSLWIGDGKISRTKNTAFDFEPVVIRSESLDRLNNIAISDPPAGPLVTKIRGTSVSYFRLLAFAINASPTCSGTAGTAQTNIQRCKCIFKTNKCGVSPRRKISR